MDIENLLKVYYKRNEHNIDKVRKQTNFILNTYSRPQENRDQMAENSDISRLNVSHKFYQLANKPKDTIIADAINMQMKCLNNIMRQSKDIDNAYLYLPHYASYDKKYLQRNNDKADKEAMRDTLGHTTIMQQMNDAKLAEIENFIGDQNEYSRQMFENIENRLENLDHNISNKIRSFKDSRMNIPNQNPAKKNGATDNRGEPRSILPPKQPPAIKTKKKVTMNVSNIPGKQENEDNNSKRGTNTKNNQGNYQPEILDTLSSKVSMNETRSKLRIVVKAIRFVLRLQNGLRAAKKKIANDYNTFFPQLVDMLSGGLKIKLSPLINLLTDKNYNINIITNQDNLQAYTNKYDIIFKSSQDKYASQDNFKDFILKFLDSCFISLEISKQIKSLTSTIFRPKSVLPKKFFFDYELEKVRYTYNGICQLDDKDKFYVFFNLIFVKLAFGMLFNSPVVAKYKTNTAEAASIKSKMIIVSSAILIIYNDYVMPLIDVPKKPPSVIKDQFKPSPKSPFDIIPCETKNPKLFLADYIHDEEIVKSIQASESEIMEKVNSMFFSYKNML